MSINATMIGNLITSHLDRDDKKFQAYAYFIRDSYLKEGDELSAKVIDRHLENDKSKQTACLDSFSYWKPTYSPGCFTPGGNPVYLCANCGYVFGSHMIHPNYNYCPICGRRMLTEHEYEVLKNE